MRAQHNQRETQTTLPLLVPPLPSLLSTLVMATQRRMLAMLPVRSERLRWLATKAEARYRRRREITCCFVAYSFKRWRCEPRIWMRVHAPALHSWGLQSRLYGRYSCVYYEDVLHLQEEAEILWLRLRLAAHSST